MTHTTSEGANEWPPILPKGSCEGCDTPWASETTRLMKKKDRKPVWVCRVCELNYHRKQRFKHEREEKMRQDDEYKKAHQVEDPYAPLVKNSVPLQTQS